MVDLDEVRAIRTAITRVWEDFHAWDRDTVRNSKGFIRKGKYEEWHKNFEKARRKEKALIGFAPKFLVEEVE